MCGVDVWFEQGHPRAGFLPGSHSPLPQLVAPVSLKLPTGTEGWLHDRRTRGVTELREETSWRGAIPVGARGGFGVNREIVGGSSGRRLKSLASRSIDASLISWDIDGQILCRRLSVSGSQCCRLLVKSRVGPEMKQDLLLFSWSWRPGVAVDWLASMLVDVHYLNLAAVDVDAKGGGCYWRHKEISEMANRRDWGGGGDDPEESTQRMIERIWESLTDIRARMDQQAPVPPVAVPSGDGEAVPVAPVLPRVEVPFAARVPPPPPMLIAEEPVMQVEKFLRLQPPTYLGGPNPDTAEHWVHEIERVFATMRCSAADRVVLAAYQLRGEFPTEPVTREAHPYPHR
ncbi:hypothetical protein Taro_026648 [Colocasia esculenta]|uniref:Uncharacterized protein n=1 Tax=Colocasia esculenta TaxID=4460 RepID=A0A843VCF4_COLES|nr:hypothetical protein [Colocasia esculenta]